MASNHSISLNEAVAMTQRYRTNKEAIIKDGYDKNILSICETFDRASIDNLLSTPGCISFRIYFGMSENLLIHAIMVAVDADGADILPNDTSALAAEKNPDIVETGQRCPPVCPPASPLNG